MTEKKVFHCSTVATVEDKENAVNEMHISAFDYYHPIRNFLYHLGMRNSDQFIKEVDEGMEVVVDDDVRELANEFLKRWTDLIVQVKAGQEIKTSPTIFGRITINYDSEKITSSEKEKDTFRKFLKAICVLARLDVDDVMKKMLS